MLRKELLDALGFVSREVVGNDVDLAATGLAGDQLREKRDKLLGGMPRGRLSQNLSRFRVERRVQGERAVPVVLESVPLEATWRERQNRIETVQSLNGGLLIHAEHRSVLRRIQIQADDVGRLRLEVRIIRRHVSLHPVRLDPGPRPRPGHKHVVDPHRRGQASRAPVRRPIRRLLPGLLEDLRLKLRRQDAGFRADMPRIQAGQPLRLEPLLPPADITRVTAQGCLNRRVALTACQKKNQSSPPGVFGSQPSRAASALKFFALHLSQRKHVSNHASLTQ